MTTPFLQTARFLIVPGRCLVAVLLCFPSYLFAQKTITLRLADLQSQGKLININRDVSIGLAV